MKHIFEPNMCSWAFAAEVITGTNKRERSIFYIFLYFAFSDFAAERPLLDAALGNNADVIEGLVRATAFLCGLRRHRGLQGLQDYQGHTLHLVHQGLGAQGEHDDVEGEPLSVHSLCQLLCQSPTPIHPQLQVDHHVNGFILRNAFKWRLSAQPFMDLFQMVSSAHCPLRVFNLSQNGVTCTAWSVALRTQG